MALSAAIVLAAGEGTRMRSNKPKVLHAFAGKTFLNRVMDSVAALNPDTLAVVVHFQAERVAEAARSYDEQVTIVNQDDIPGTGRAVQCAMAQLTEAGKVDGPVLIAASDMPLLDSETLHRLVEFHTASGNGATVLTTILDDPTGYGRIIRDREGNVLRIVEQKDANRSELAVQEVNTSVYVFEASVLTEAIAGLKSNNAQGEFYLTDALETAKAAGKAGAFVEMKKAHIGNGTKVPHLSYVGDAQLGDHTNIGGGTITANYDGLHKNRTTIGSGCHVGAGNLFVAPVEVGDNVTTGAGSVVRHAVPSDTMVYSENTQHNVEGWKPAWER